MNADYVAENDAERARLFAVLDALSEDDLKQRVASDLTVAAVLVHLAFWDDYRAALVARWMESGFAPVKSDFDALNFAVADIAAAVPLASVVGLARRAAEAADRQIALVAPELAATAITGGFERTLRSAVHRRLHVDQIELAVGEPASRD